MYEYVQKDEPSSSKLMDVYWCLGLSLRNMWVGWEETTVFGSNYWLVTGSSIIDIITVLSFLLQSQVEELQVMSWVGPQKKSWVNEIKHVLKSFRSSIQNWWSLWWLLLSFHCVSVQYRPHCLFFWCVFSEQSLVHCEWFAASFDDKGAQICVSLDFSIREKGWCGTMVTTCSFLA